MTINRSAVRIQSDMKALVISSLRPPVGSLFSLGGIAICMDFFVMISNGNMGQANGRPRGLPQHECPCYDIYATVLCEAHFNYDEHIKLTIKFII